MELPNGEVIMHEGRPYDPAKAHEYYLRTRKLKGRKQGVSKPPPSFSRGGQVATTRAHQKQKISEQIQTLQDKLSKLEDLIKAKEAALKRSQSAQKDKKPTATDKSKQARESKKYRRKHKAELAAKAKKAASKSGGGSSKGAGSGKSNSDKSIKELKSLATKVRGQIHVAKAKLSAL